MIYLGTILIGVSVLLALAEQTPFGAAAALFVAIAALYLVVEGTDNEPPI